MSKIRYSSFFRLFGVILFIYVLARINTRELADAFKGMNPFYYFTGIVFFALGFLARVFRWKALAESIGARVSFQSFVKMMAGGVFLGLITPGKVGEFWRTKYLAEKTGVEPGKAFYTTFTDRAVDLLVMGGIALFGLMAVGLKFSGIKNQELIALTVLFLFIISTIFLVRQSGIKKLLKILIKFLFPSFLKSKADSFLEGFYQGFEGLKPRLFLKISFLGLLYYILIGPIFHYFITLSLGISLPFWYLFLVIAIAWFAGALPVTILGLGTREVTLIYFFSFFGIPSSSTVALSLLALFCNVSMVGLPGAILFLRKKL